ncbi:MAG: superoxide dismutase [Parachlamydiaceae bacterium]
MKKFLVLALVSSGIHLACLHAATPELTNKPKQDIVKYQIKNFDHLLGKIPGLSNDLLKMHFKLYEGYVNNTNTLLEKLKAIDIKDKNQAQEFAGLKRMLGWEFNGMLLHEYYFENLGTTPFLKENSAFLAKVNEDFGGYESWKKDFIATGLIRGIGWVVTYVDPKSGRLINEWINEHDVGHLSGGKPILIMDVFEHAYITQFGLERNKYIEIFFNNINWDIVEKRFQEQKESKKA